MESGRNNEVILMVRGLPRDIDPTNIQVFYSQEDLEDAGEIEEAVNDGDDSNIPPLKKLKLICLSGQEKNFRREGRFGEKFRTRYTKEVK